MSWYTDIKTWIANNIRTNHQREITGAKMNTVLNDIVDEVEKKVDKVSGKGLSTNDYTDTDKAKVTSALQTETDPTVPSWAKAQTKPTYTASEVGAIPATDKGANGGVATLDNAGKVPQSQLPSYVDDVLEYSNLASFPATGESGKIYVALDTNKIYRWSGSAYVEIPQGLALGETSSTAFPGDRGKAIEDKIPSSASSSNKLATNEDVNGVNLLVEQSSLTDQQRNIALANVSNQTANSTTGKMGYKVLDPTKTFAEQVTAENTIYEIRDVFDLNNGSVTIPNGSKLRFEGGRIINGTINGNKTIIVAEPYKIFDTNIILAGTFLNDCIYTEWFGAKADGSTDNFAIFQYVFDTSIQIGIPIQLIEGTYVIDECPAALDGQTLKINFTQDGQSFVLLGKGMDKTTVKSADKWLDRLWSKHDSGSAVDNDIMRQKKLIYYYRNNNWVAELIKICDITFNRNGSSNTVTPPSAYAWEGQGIISSAGATGYTGTAKNFVYKNLLIKDRTSAGIVFGNAKCDSVLIDGLMSDRQIYFSGVREEIYPLVQCTNTIIRNCDVQFIQIEAISEQTGNRNTTIENCHVDSIEWTDNNRTNVLSIKNCTLNNAYLYVSGTTLNVDGCSFYYTDSAFGQSESKNTFISGKEVNITNCVFHFTPNENYVCKQILIGNDTSQKSIVTFKNCSFVSETISRFNMIEGHYRYQAETNESNANVTFEDCYFSWNSDMTSFDGPGYLIMCHRGLNATINNCTINRLSNTYLIRIGETSNGFGSVKIHNLKIIGSYGYDKFIAFYNVVNSGSIVDIDGEYPFVQLFRTYNLNSMAEYGSSIENLILVTNNPSDILSIERKTYIRGTKIKVGNLLYKYNNALISNPDLSINDFVVTPINEIMTQVEIDAINTTYLPSNSPVKVFNSTLGKYVMWYGSAWVNLDGTALS